MTERGGPLRDGELPREWLEAVADLFRCLDTEDFPAAFRRVLGRLFAFDSMVITEYRGTGRPSSLYHDLDDIKATISLAFYESGPYLLDPFYLACRNETEPGAYRLTSLAPDAFFRSEYYSTFYRRIRISDEMGLLICAGDDHWIVISLARSQRQPRFEDSDVTAANAAFAILSAAALRHWGQASVRKHPDKDRDMQERLLSFGADTLSPRELEVVQLVLLGHSTPSAATCLGIAEGTVKVHRRHAYAKLGIASQAELFSLATRYLAGQAR